MGECLYENSKGVEETIQVDEHFWKEWCGLQMAKAFDRLYSDEALLEEAHITKSKLEEMGLKPNKKELKR